MEALIARWHGRGRLAYAVTGALRADQHARAAGARRRACAPPTPASTCRPTWPRTGPRSLGCASCSRRRAATSTSTPAPACCMRTSVFAHGIWLEDADRAALAAAGAQIAHSPVVEPVPRQRPVRLARRRGRGASRQPGERRRRRHEPVDAAHRWPRPTRCRRSPASASPRGRRCTRPRAARRARSASSDEIGSLEPGAHGRRLHLGAGRSARSPARRHDVARTLHERVFAWMTLADERNLRRSLRRRREPLSLSGDLH